MTLLSCFYAFSFFCKQGEDVNHNDTKFSDRQALANSADPGQIARRVLYTVCHFILNNFFYGKTFCLNVLVITAKILSVRTFKT